MIVLGIADNHDSGAAVVIDGRLVSAVNQERIDRLKNSGAFPYGAIDSALEAAGVRARDVDRVVVGTGFTPSAALRARPDFHHSRKDQGQFSPLLHAYIVYQSTLRATGLHATEVELGRQIITRRLQERPLGDATVEMMDHHMAHAHGAYRTQGRDHSLVLTVDAMGDGTTATAWLGQGGQIDLLWRQSGLAAVNTFYSRITEWLGFRPNRHEGKITGLAAYVEPPSALLQHMRKRLHYQEPGFSKLSARRLERKDDAFWGELSNWSREEIAATAQVVLEESVCSFVDHWVQKTGCGDLSLAGGIFANVKLNQRIAELPSVRSVWVMPHMGDGGLPVGAALGSSGAAPTPLPHACWGPEFSDRDAYKALDRGELPQINRQQQSEGGETPGDVERVAQLLAQSKTVAVCRGRMEWGPRALCHRSILARPDDPSINDWLNEKLDRSEFMPFAPVARIEDAGRYFKGVDQAPDSAQFMTICFDTTEEFKQNCAAAVHVDGTARPQLVSRQSSPHMHALLTRLDALTGTGVLINTSFNLHEEPIVCTPSDAVRAFEAAKLDALWLGPYVAEREPSSSE
jgi:carbamoyltransferase